MHTNMNTRTQAHTCTYNVHTCTQTTHAHIYPHNHKHVHMCAHMCSMRACMQCMHVEMRMVCVCVWMVYVCVNGVCVQNANGMCVCVCMRERGGSITCMCEWTTTWEHILTSGWWPNALKAHQCWLRGQRHSTSPTRLLLLPIAHSNLEEIPLTFHKTGEQTYKTDKDEYAVNRYIQRWIARYNRQIDRSYSSPLTSGNPSSGTIKLSLARPPSHTPDIQRTQFLHVQLHKMSYNPSA